MRCWAIADLADVFRELIALEELALHCEEISELPATFGNLTLLKELSCYNAGTGVTVKNWKSLKGENSLESLVTGHDAVPDALQHLLWYLTKVKHLKLLCVHGATAVVVRNMINLVSLEISVPDEQAVPDIFGNLEKLGSLKLSCRAVENNRVESFTAMTSVEDIQLSGIVNLNVIPESLGNLYSLHVLEVEHCPIQSLPESLGQLQV
ncbi:hypothetical protein R1flu_003383 [Riccia fluitans]|uniref:Uncharacterized protein n=1 Tax=Riccia fluitans TaxID=41844 RepID=A0ABD1Y8Z4_9MARC